MEDLTGEVQQESETDEQDADITEEQGSADGSQDGSQKEKTEGNSCISMYFQSKDHSVVTGVCL